ncbi:integrase [Caulobacter phage Cr30]|uniref:integrase n=1 Tax=Caulobacter phage Cr30 TaxID=1357714 RepID=UPI0004A9B9C9|nr:integrase [Caulobacter phage Cr30]AGS81037.1 integrase [Caulobacter phage Cr30]
MDQYSVKGINRMLTFHEAAISYVEHGGEERYLRKLIEHFGNQDVSKITPMAVRNSVKIIFPNSSPATHNRQVITPMRAVLYHAHEMGWRMPAKIKSFYAPKTKLTIPANRKWLETFIDQCDKDELPHLAACVLFMNLTGARVSEAVNFLGKHINLRERKAILIKTKTDFNSIRYLPDHLVERLRDLNIGPEDRAFKYKCRFSVNERIGAVCNRAGIQYKSSHTVGRHSFATNALNAGVSVRVAMDAGGWKSSSIFLETYSHSMDAGKRVADIFNLIHQKDQE